MPPLTARPRRRTANTQTPNPIPASATQAHSQSPFLSQSTTRITRRTANSSSTPVPTLAGRLRSSTTATSLIGRGKEREGGTDTAAAIPQPLPIPRFGSPQPEWDAFWSPVVENPEQLDVANAVPQTQPRDQVQQQIRQGEIYSTQDEEINKKEWGEVGMAVEGAWKTNDVQKRNNDHNPRGYTHYNHHGNGGNGGNTNSNTASNRIQDEDEQVEDGEEDVEKDLPVFSPLASSRSPAYLPPELAVMYADASPGEKSPSPSDPGSDAASTKGTRGENGIFPFSTSCTICFLSTLLTRAPRPPSAHPSTPSPLFDTPEIQNMIDPALLHSPPLPPLFLPSRSPRPLLTHALFPPASRTQLQQQARQETQQEKEFREHTWWRPTNHLDIRQLGDLGAACESRYRRCFEYVVSQRLREQARQRQQQQQQMQRPEHPDQCHQTTQGGIRPPVDVTQRIHDCQSVLRIVEELEGQKFGEQNMNGIDAMGIGSLGWGG